jgi:limonene-1,2-epoxide hydrolase
VNMTDSEVRDLCNRFFDAYQDRRVDLLAEIYAPDCIVWHNVYGRDTTGADNLAALPASYEMQRRRTYNDRIINTFDGGFVIQYTLHGVQHSGHRGALWICIVGLCRDGKITRIDEYMDSGKFPAWRAARLRKSPVAVATGDNT